ncbi:MAG TPA: hypothetical protein PKV98_12110 [Burkholderiaceae bacterium]|nr:hypothetical protein [Burkholderiaceae bacterium]
MNPADLATAEFVEHQASLVRTALQRAVPEDCHPLAAVSRKLRDIPPGVHSEGQLFALTGVCRYFQAPGRDCAQALEAAILLAKRAQALGRSQERLTALMCIALIHGHLDNHLEALEACVLARNVAAELGLPSAEVAMLVLASESLRISADPSQAEAVARKALSIAATTCDVEEHRVLAWLTIAKLHLTVEQYPDGLASVGQARAAIVEDADPGLAALIDYVEALLKLATGSSDEAVALAERVATYAMATRTAEATLLSMAVRGAVEAARGRAVGRARLWTTLEKARRMPRELPEVLAASIVAGVASGDTAWTERARAELQSFTEARRSADRLKATLVRGPLVGLGALGKRFDAEAYERRLQSVKDRLLSATPSAPASSPDTCHRPWGRKSEHATSAQGGPSASG